MTHSHDSKKMGLLYAPIRECILEKAGIAAYTASLGSLHIAAVCKTAQMLERTEC